MRALFVLIWALLVSASVNQVAWADSAPAARDAEVAPPAAAAAAASSESASALRAMEQRVRDLEAYVNNGARGVDAPSRISGPGPGHNGWLMVCTALVLFMTLPGLALFYGGMVRAKNVLSVLAQCLGLTGIVSLLWWALGYSLVFAPGSPWLGDLRFAWFRGVESAPNVDYAGWVSHNIFAIYQLMFAIITPALIVGAIAERMKFSTLLAFLTAWMLLVYFPLAHMVWGIDGWMNGVWNANARIRAVDFAGGTVVHMSSGWSALLLALVLGKRKGFGHANFAPHNLVLTTVGTGMLWVGWYGFNAGSALAADAIAAQAFTTTTLAAAVAGGTWPLLEWTARGKPTVLGFCSGIVAGLVGITPGAGFVSAGSAVLIGFLAGVVTYFACTKLKNHFRYDDSLDTFGVHAVGGTLGALLTGLLARGAVNPNLETNLASYLGGALWLEQLKAVGVTLLLSLSMTGLLACALKWTLGLRLSPEDEEVGLDLSEHGERAYHLGDV